MTAMLFSRRPAESALLGEPQGELALRVRAAGREEQVIRLTGAKCSIGSGATCSLRLRAPGIEAMHCLILRGSEGTMIRALGTALRLNGHACEEARLEVGDFFSLGTISFEVLSDSAGGGKRKQRRHFLENTPADATTQIAEARRETRRQQHARLRRLLNAMRGDRLKSADQRREFERRRKESEQLRQDLVHLQRELAEERNQGERLEDQRRKSLSKANQLELTLERLRNELTALQLQKQQEAELFRQERARLNEDLSSRERHAHQLRIDLQQRLWDLDQLRLQLERLQRQADLDREQHRAAADHRQQEQEAWLAERARVLEEFSARERQATQLHAELQTAQAACQQLQSEVQKSATALEQSRIAAENRERAASQELAQVRSAKEKACLETENWKQAHAKLSNELNERDRWAKELETELAQQQATSERLAKELKHSRIQIDQLTKEAGELQERWSRDHANLQLAIGQQETEESWKVSKAQLLNSLASQEQENASVRSELRKVLDDLAQARKLLEDQTIASAACQSAWETERKDFSDRIETLQSSQQAAEDGRREAAERLAKAEDERSAAEARQQVIEEEIAGVRDRLLEAEATSQALRQAAEEGQARIGQLERKLASQSAMLEVQPQQTIALDVTKSQRYQALEHQVAELTSLKQGLERQVEELSAQAERNAKVTSEQSQLLQVEREQLALREQQLGEQVALIETRQAELEAQLAALEARRASSTVREDQLASEGRELEQRQTDLALRVRQLEEREASLHAETLALERVKREFTVPDGLSATIAVSQSYSDEAAVLPPELEELQRERAALAEEREQLNHERIDLQRVREQLTDERAVLAEQERLLDEKLQQVAVSGEALERCRQEVAVEREQVSPPRGETIVRNAADDVAAESSIPADEEIRLVASPEPANLKTGSQAANPVSNEEELDGRTIIPSSMDLSRLAALDFEGSVTASGSAAPPAESVEEVLARLGRQGLWKQEEEKHEPAALSLSDGSLENDGPNDPALAPWSALKSTGEPPATREPASWRSQGGPSNPPEDSEESIDAYMARLMNRVQGSDPTAPAPVSRPVVEQPTPKRSTKLENEAVTSLPAGEYSPRTTAPEQSHSLAAMREIANESARSAIRVHEKKSGKIFQVGHLVSATVLALLSIPMLWLSRECNSWLFFGGFVAALCLAGWWMRGTAMGLLRAIKKTGMAMVLRKPSAE